GRPGLAKFASTWPYFLIAYGVGVGVIAQLFATVVERERLNAAERRFRALLDEASEAIRIVEPDQHRIVETNLADSALTGHPRSSLLGRDGRDFWPTDVEERGRWEKLLDETARAGAASAFGLQYHTVAGPRTIDLTCRRVEHDGRPYDIVIFRD